MNKIFKLFVISFLMIIFNSCFLMNGTYYEYLSSPPQKTTDYSHKNIYYSKKTGDSTYYYYWNSKIYYTKDTSKLKNVYLLAIKSMKWGKRDGQWIRFDGFGDTVSVHIYKNYRLINSYLKF